MATISKMRASAMKLRTEALKKFESIKTLDSNPLFDADQEAGSVQVQQDTWHDPSRPQADPVKLTASAKFDEEGQPLEMATETYEVMKYVPEGEMSAQYRSESYSITQDGENTIYRKESYGPGMGSFPVSYKAEGIFDSSGVLVDFSEYR